ncbi:MAG TPA: sulfatase-like hydrolase/transferase [Acidimicrobiales bacterium]|nr:sulfatase-like hydrolase/transferase [Acidimicrobiales bacterium]
MTDASDSEGHRGRFRRIPRELGGSTLVLLLLSGAYPYAAFVGANRGESLPIPRLAVYAVSTALLALVVCLALLVIFRRLRGPRLAVAAAVFIFLFFNYVRFVNIGTGGTGASLWMLAVLFGVLGGYVLARFSAVRLYVLAAVFLLTGFPVAQYSIFRASVSADVPSRAASGTLSGVTEKPNIWFFMLDGYARGDRFPIELGRDNTEFIAGLRNRGFAVNENSYSSYSHTIGSLSSMLEMDYPSTGRLPGGERTLVPVVRGENALVRTLKSSGYTYVHAEPGTWEVNRCESTADVCLPPLRGAGVAIGEVEQSLMSLTPLRKALRKLGVKAAIDSGYTTPTHTIDEFDAARPKAPYFVFSHQLSPHPPWRFGPDCTEFDQLVGELGFWDPEFKDDYIGEVECLNRRMLEAMDRIVAADPKAIVVILSDHGTGFDVEFTKDAAKWSLREINQRFAAFSAVRMPERCPQDEQAINFTVNTFRRVIACIENRPPRLLDYRAFVVLKKRHALLMDEVKRRGFPAELADQALPARSGPSADATEGPTTTHSGGP